MSYSIKNMVRTSKSLYLNTYGGDFLKIKLKLDKDKSGVLKLRVKEQRIKNIAMLENGWRTLTLIEKNDEKLIFIGGEKGTVYGFSNDTHEIIDIFSHDPEKVITTMDAIISDDIHPIFVYGTDTGKVMLRKNWTSNPNFVEIEEPI